MTEFYVYAESPTPLTRFVGKVYGSLPKVFKAAKRMCREKGYDGIAGASLRGNRSIIIQVAAPPEAADKVDPL